VSALYSFGKLVLTPVLRTAWRPKVTGLDNVPETGPVIIASNHLSVVDSILIPIVTNRPVFFLAKDEYFKNPLTKVIMTGLNQIPVDRSGGRASLMALDAALPVLADGHVLGIFPEGTRSPDGRLYRGRPGVARLALDSGATLIPAGLVDTEQIQPIGSNVPRLGPGVRVHFGKPMDLSPWSGGPADTKALRTLTAALMTEIANITGQKYVGRYAPKRDDAA